MNRFIQVTPLKLVNIDTVLMIDDNQDGTYKVTTSMISAGNSVVFSSVAAAIIHNAFAQFTAPPPPLPPNPPPPPPQGK